MRMRFSRPRAASFAKAWVALALVFGFTQVGCRPRSVDKRASRAAEKSAVGLEAPGTTERNPPLPGPLPPPHSSSEKVVGSGSVGAAGPDSGVQLAGAPGTAPLTPAQQSRRTPVVDAVNRAAPSVVSILTEQKPQQNPFAYAFGMPGLGDDEESGSGRTSLGSGVVVDPHGMVVTNEHVVAGAARIRVQLADGRELPATLIGADQSFDLAVLKVDLAGPGAARELPALRLGTAQDLMIGETVVAIGNPFGLAHTVTSGVISALHRVVRAKNRTYEDFIQIDAQINPGNSGGPLLNIHGELIGINTAVHSGGPGIGFAIPIDRARTIVNDLLQFGRVRYGWIGIRPAPLQQRRRDKAPGVVVAEVEAGSPAARAGVQPGDVVAGVNDEPTASVEGFWDRVQHILAGDEVRLKLLRGEVKLQAAPLEPKEVSARAQKRLGLDVTDVEGRAVLVRRVLAGGIGERIGFQPGDAILQIGARAVRNSRDYATALGELRPGSDTVMLVVRGQYSYYITIPL
jgi:serine protease Do